MPDDPAGDVVRGPDAEEALERLDDLARELDLTDAQRAATESVYAGLRDTAQPIGIKIIEAERDLDKAFVNGTITSTELRSRLNAIAILQGQLRTVSKLTWLSACC